MSTKEAEETVDLWCATGRRCGWQAVQHKNGGEGQGNTLGRHRNLPEGVGDSDEMRRGHALLCGILDQGGAADIAMLAMIRVPPVPEAGGLGFKLLMQIPTGVEGPGEHETGAGAGQAAHGGVQRPREPVRRGALRGRRHAKTWFEAK